MRIAVLTGVVALAAGPVAAETWQAFSRSPNNAFLAEVDNIAVEGDITSIRVATVPLASETGDLSHSVEIYQFQCGQDRWRTAGLTEFGPEGTEAGQFPEEGSAWEPVRADTMPSHLEKIACDSIRVLPPHWSTVQAFVEAGRP